MMDMLTSLPLEIAQSVFRFLKPRELCNAALVSKTWRDIACSDAVWKRHVIRLGLLDDVPQDLDSGNKYKNMYVGLVHNWRNKKYSQFNLPQYFSVHVHGDAMVAHTVEPAVQLFWLEPTGPRLVYNIHNNPYVTLFHPVAMSQDYIVITCILGVKVYKYSSTECHLHSAYRLDNNNLHTYTPNEVAKFNKLSEDGYLDDIYITLDGDMLYLCWSPSNKEPHYVHSVRLTDLKHSCSPPLDPLDWRVKFSVSKGLVFIYSPDNDIKVYSRDVSSHLMTLHTDPSLVYLASLSCMDSYIVALYKCERGEKVVKVWDRNSGRPVFTRHYPRSELDATDVVLSAHTLYVGGLQTIDLPEGFEDADENVSTERYILTATNLQTSSKLWSREYDWDPVDFSVSYLFFAPPEFLVVVLCVPDREYSSCFVCDAITGAGLYTIPIAQNLGTIYVTPKYIILQSNCGLDVICFLPEADKAQPASSPPNQLL